MVSRKALVFEGDYLWKIRTTAFRMAVATGDYGGVDPRFEEKIPQRTTARHGFDLLGWCSCGKSFPVPVPV